jgi:3-polyprenyl-4-hydroxybenzoate decarboxylase
MVVFLYEMKYILAVTGASGIVYGVRLNEELKKGV